MQFAFSTDVSFHGGEKEGTHFTTLTLPIPLSQNTKVQAINSYPKQIKNKMPTSLVKFFFYSL